MEFGEIIEVSSRAFWDDYDSPENAALPIPKLEWQWTNSNSNQNIIQHPIAKQFILIEGHSAYIRDFRATVLKGCQPLCQLTYHKTAIYSFPSENVVLCLNEEGDENQFAAITNMLQTYIEKSEKVLVISTQHSSKYKGNLQMDDDNQEIVFMRSLCSNKTMENATIERLTVPNIITGVAAGVVTLRQHISKTYDCFVVYMDSQCFDSTTALPVLKLIEQQCNGYQFKTNLDYYRVLSKQSNLYT